ncbi:hypothetical protein ACN38_g12534, partial [Penicillium nordicum]
PLHF